MIPVSNTCRENCDKSVVNYEEYIIATGVEKTFNGKTITLSDNVQSIDKIRIYGKSTQNSYDGYQLYNVQDTKQLGNEVTIDFNGWITITYDNSQGSSTKYIDCQMNRSNLIHDGTEYSVITEIDEATGNYTLFVNDNTGFSQFKGQGNSIDYNYTNVHNGDIKIKNLIAREDTSYSSYISNNSILNTYLAIGSGKSASIKFRISIYKKDVLERLNNFIYEPFLGGRYSPSSSYPQPINSVTGNVTITATDGTQTSSITYDLGQNELTKYDYIENDKLYKFTGVIDSYNGENILTDYMSTTGRLSTGATIYYKLETPQIINISKTGSLSVYEDETNISSNIETTMQLTCSTTEKVNIIGKLSENAFNDRNFIGTFNLKELIFETENNIKYKNSEIVYYKRINNEDIKIGTFIVTEIEDSDTNEWIKVTAVDYGLKFATNYETALDYENEEITMQDVLEEVLENVGVELSSNSQELVNKDFVVDSNQFTNNEVNGDVISAIASINGMFAIIDENDKLKLLLYEDTTRTETTINYEIVNYSRAQNNMGRKYLVYNDFECEDGFYFRVEKQNLFKYLTIDDINYELNAPTDAIYIQLTRNNSYIRDCYIHYIGAGDLLIEDGVYYFDITHNKIMSPSGQEYIPNGSAEYTSGNIDISFSYPSGEYGFRTEEDEQKYIDKYFDGDESQATYEYVPTYDLNINVVNPIETQESHLEIIEDYTNFDDKRDTRPITVVQVGMSQVQGVEVQARWESGISQYGENFLIINDNPFAYTMEKRYTLANNILEKVKGFGYSSFVTDYAFKPYLQLGDKVYIRNKNGDLVESVILKIDSNFDDITLSAPSIADASIEYVETDTERIARRAEVIANQADGKITILSKEVDNIGKTVETGFEHVNENFNNYYTIDQTNAMIIDAKTGVTNIFEQTGGSNIFRNTGLWFAESGNNNAYEFWTGSATRTSEMNATNGNAIIINNGSFIQEQEVPNGTYTISFRYQRLAQFANTSVVINDVEYDLDSLTEKEFYTGEQDTQTGDYITQPINVTSRRIKIEFKSDTNNGLKIYELMCNKGDAKLAYTQNENETTTDTVNISKGITITSTNMETIFKANADGIKILTLSGSIVAYFTDKGLSTKELIVENEAQIVKTLWQEVGDQTWITRI